MKEQAGIIRNLAISTHVWLKSLTAFWTSHCSKCSWWFGRDRRDKICPTDPRGESAPWITIPTIAHHMSVTQKIIFEGRKWAHMCMSAESSLLKPTRKTYLPLGQMPLCVCKWLFLNTQKDRIEKANSSHIMCLLFWSKVMWKESFPYAWKILRGRNEVFKGILMIMKGTGLIGQETAVLLLVPEGK